MKHFKVVQTALDPDDYAQKVQADADAFDDETRRAVTKHPDQKQVREARLQDYQKSVSELIEFLGRNSLVAAHLDGAKPEVSGWVFFNAKNKWLGGWKAQEEFVLRVPLDGKTFEFPFKLPPRKPENCYCRNGSKPGSAHGVRLRSGAAPLTLEFGGLAQDDIAQRKPALFSSLPSTTGRCRNPNSCMMKKHSSTVSSRLTARGLASHDFRNRGVSRGAADGHDAVHDVALEENIPAKFSVAKYGQGADVMCSIMKRAASSTVRVASME